MNTLVRVLTSRNALSGLAVVAAMAVLGHFFGTIAIPIRLNALSAPHRIPVAVHGYTHGSTNWAQRRYNEN